MAVWLQAGAALLMIFAILIAACEGVLKVRRDRSSNEIGRRIFQIRVSAEESVARLMAIQKEIDERIRKRWWKTAEIDKTRWGRLNELIQNRVKEAKDMRTRALLSEIRAAKHEQGVDEETRQEHLSKLAERAWSCLEHGELGETDHSLLLKVIDENPPHVT